VSEAERAGGHNRLPRGLYAHAARHSDAAMPHTAPFIPVKATDGVNAREFSFGSKVPFAIYDEHFRSAQ
jgi:hypothetical protein